jgi:hypothetical protein
MKIRSSGVITSVVLGWGAALLVCLGSASAVVGGDDAASEDAPDLSGVFRNAAGAEVRLYDLARSDAQTESGVRWLMRMGAPGEPPLTFLLAPAGDDWVPVGLEASAPYRGSTVFLSTRGDRVYCRTQSGDRLLEAYTDGAQPVATAHNGQQTARATETARQVELRLMSREYAATWNQLRRRTIRIRPDRVDVIPDGPVDPLSFDRVRDLNETEEHAMRGMLETRRALVESAQAFREQRQ